MRHILGLFTIALSIVAGSPALAQGPNVDDKYGPKKFSRADLIDFGTFASSPLKLPWTVERTRQVPEGSHVNFEHQLTVDVGTVRDHLEKARNEGKPALHFAKSAQPKGAPSGLEILGSSKTPDGTFRYTLGNAKMRRHFTIVLEQRDEGAVLTFENVALTIVYGGGVPKRAPFRPVDADPLPLAE